MTTKEQYENTRRLHEAEGNLAYGLAVFGDHVAAREGFKSVTGLDAVHMYLIRKHNWLPSQVRSMSYADLRFLMDEEMTGWTLPADAR